MIRSRASWGARHRDGVGNRPVGSLEKYLHHSVTRHLPKSASVAEEQVQMRTVEGIGQQRFGAGISYTFGILPSGRIYQGASVGRIAYHSGAGRNTRGVGICLIGNTESHEMTTEQFAALVWLLQEGVRRGWWQDPAITEGHRDFSATACPGRHAYSQIGEINRRGRGGQVEDPSPAPAKPTGQAWPSRLLPENGKRTQAWHNAWVRLMRDIGYTDASLGRNLQRWLAALGYYRRAIDGDFGAWSIRALQTFLRDRGHYDRAIDGDRGPMTVTAEKAYLNAQARFYR